MKRNTLMLAVMLPTLLGGCATGSPLHLNEPARSQASVDVANLRAPREVPYETQEQEGIAVRYNLFFLKDDNFSGYRLTLILRNNTNRPEVFMPEVLLRDATGLVLQPDTYEGFMSLAAALAGTSVPPIPVAQNDRYYHQGAVTSPSGRTYTYSGTTTSDPSGDAAGSFARGFAQGRAMRAARDREDGRLMLRWGTSYWLKERYTVPPKSAVSGALLFSSRALTNLPLTITVNLAQRQFEFKTVTSAR